MALQLKYSDEHGILHIDMTPSTGNSPEKISNPKFDSINQRFGKYDLFGGKYEEGSNHSLFRSRYNSFEEELANTPYAFATDRSEVLDITIEKDIEDNRFFDHDLFGPKIDLKKSDSFTVTQLIHAQDRYYDLSKKGKVRSIAEGFEVKSAPTSAKRTSGKGAFKVLTSDVKLGVAPNLPTVPTSKRKGESSFAIIADPLSRPNSPRSLPVEIRPGRVSPFKGRGFREETSRHNTPKTSAANSRSNSPPRRTHSLSRIDKMAQVATLPPPGPVHRPPRDFLKENIEEIRELSELNREKNEAEADKKKMEEEIALLKEMGLIDKTGDIKSGVHSRTNSRSNSPNRYNLRSRSNSPSAILHLNNLSARSSEFLNKDEAKPVAHRSRMRTVSKSQPQSCNGSPKHSKIPTRQNSVSPNRSNSRQSLDKGISRHPRNISNSTSSIHESIRIGSTVHDKRASQSSQHLSITPSTIKSKPPISPGKSGPPPSNKSINPKRLSPIVGTPSKSPLEGSKLGVGKAPMKTSVTKANTPMKATGATSAASRLNSRQPSRNNSRDSSPEKRKLTTGSISKSGNVISKSVSRTSSTRAIQKPPTANKSDPKKPVSRTNSVKNLSRTPSTKTLNEKPPLNKQLSKKDVSEKTKPSIKVNESKTSKSTNSKETITKTGDTKDEIKDRKDKVEDNRVDANVGDSIERHDNETQYDKKTNEKEELVIMTKKNVVSMTTAAITSQPLEVVATVTNQLPAALEKAREKAMFEILNSKDSLLSKEDEKDSKTEEVKSEKDDKKTLKSKSERAEENIKLRALQPPYNNPQVERVKQKIDSILKEPEISTENILAAAKVKDATKVVSEKFKASIKEVISETIDLKDKINNQNEDYTSEFKREASKIVDSIITPVEEPKKVMDKAKIEAKKTIEPIVTVVSEKKKEIKSDIEKITETLVQGGPEVEVLSSNVSTPGGDKIAKDKNNKMADGASDKSHSNGGFPQSTSTTPKPPPRAHREPKDRQTDKEQTQETQDNTKQNICSRLMGKCKTKCCSCCSKALVDEGEEDRDTEQAEQVVKKPFLDKLNCFKKKVPDEDVEIAAGKGTTIEFESETKRKRKIRDVLCGCCRRQRVADVSEPPRHVDVTPPVASSDVVKETGCCGKKKEAERRDSILSDQRPSTCCSALRRWITGACRRSSETSSSRRTSLFSKNKSLSPTLPPEDTRKKLDPSLIEHTSAMRGAVPVLALPLAALCLLCNILVPGLGTIFSGLFCLCFGIPRFGVHDGAKHRIGSLLINIVVGCAQLFTVLFCLVGWGWAIWWGVIMVRVSRKYSKLKAEAAAEDAEAPPVTDNNHTRP